MLPLGCARLVTIPSMLGGFLQPVKGVRTLDPGLDACDDVFGQRKLVHRDLLEQRR
jgi:hypothetical protein